MNESIGNMFCKGAIVLGSGCMRCGRCAVQLAEKVKELEARLNSHPQAQVVEPAAKRWPFVLAPSIVASLLTDALCNFDGDVLAAVRNVFIEQAIALRPVGPAQAPTPGKIYLVATGETHNGLETYTRHDAPVPLADQEVLYSGQDEFDAWRQS